MKIQHSDQNSVSEDSNPKNSRPQSKDSKDISPAQIQIQDSKQENENENKEESKPIYTWKEIIPRGILFIILAFIIIFLLINNQVVLDILETFIPWLQDNLLLGILIYWMIYSVAGVFMVPNTILGLCAGYVFYGVFNENLPLTLFIGSIITQIGSTMGATASFLTGRYVLTALVKKVAQKYKKFQAVQKALKNKGFKFVLLCRLAPINPDNIFNYLCGGTDLKFKDYFYGCIGLYPGSFVLTYFGTTIKELKEILDGEIFDGDATFIFLIIAGVVGVTVATIVGIFAKREISRILKEEEELEKKENEKEKEKQDENNDIEIQVEQGQQQLQQQQEEEEQKDINKEKDIKTKEQQEQDQLKLQHIQINQDSQ